MTIVGTIFAGRPFLLVRFLLDEQKKMNNNYRASTPRGLVVNCLLKSVLSFVLIQRKEPKEKSPEGIPSGKAGEKMVVRLRRV